MELWVRSQNKNRLIQAKYIYFDETNVENLGNCRIKTLDTTIGIYKSNERALEVLNEIQQRLIDLQTIEIQPNCYKTIPRKIDCVYQMPKE